MHHYDDEFFIDARQGFLDDPDRRFKYRDTDGWRYNFQTYESEARSGGEVGPSEGGEASYGAQPWTADPSSVEPLQNPAESQTTSGEERGRSTTRRIGTRLGQMLTRSRGSRGPPPSGYDGADDPGDDVDDSAVRSMAGRLGLRYDGADDSDNSSEEAHTEITTEDARAAEARTASRRNTLRPPRVRFNDQLLAPRPSVESRASETSSEVEPKGKEPAITEEASSSDIDTLASKTNSREASHMERPHPFHLENDGTDSKVFSYFAQELDDDYQLEPGEVSVWDLLEPEADQWKAVSDEAPLDYDEDFNIPFDAKVKEGDAEHHAKWVQINPKHPRVAAAIARMQRAQRDRRMRKWRPEDDSLGQLAQLTYDIQKPELQDLSELTLKHLQCLVLRSYCNPLFVGIKKGYDDNFKRFQALKDEWDQTQDPELGRELMQEARKQRDQLQHYMQYTLDEQQIQRERLQTGGLGLIKNTVLDSKDQWFSSENLGIEEREEPAQTGRERRSIRERLRRFVF